MADIDNPYDKVVDNLFSQNTSPQEPGPGPDLIAQKSAYPNGLPPGSVMTKGLPDDMGAPDPANDVTAPTGASDAPLRAAVMDGMQYNPEEAAKALPIARDAQLPLDMTLRNLPDLQKQADFNNIDFKTLNTDYPKLAQFFHNPDNAAVAHDDIGALQKVGDWANSFVNDQYDVDAIRDTLGEYGQNFISSAIHGAGESYYGFFQGLENAGEGLDSYMQKEHPGMDALDVFLLKSASVAMHDIGMVGAKSGEDIAKFGNEIDNQNDGLLPGITRMAGGIGGAMANPVGVVPGFMSQFAGQSYEESKKDGFDVNSTRANTAAMLNAAVAWLTGEVGPKVITEGLPASLQAKVTTGIAGMMAKHGIDPGGTVAKMAYRAADASMRAVADAVAMTGQTIAGNAINQNVLDEKGTLTQGMSDALQQGGILGVIVGLIFHHANENFHPAMNEYRTQMMDAGRQVVAESKLQGRAPEKMNQYLRSELGDRDIYVNPGAAQVFYQGLGDDERASLDKSMPEFQKQLAESMKTGEDIQIDQADYHTYMQQLEGSKNLDQWVKWIPEGTSEGDEKVHESFIKSLYEGLDGAKEKEDPVSEGIYRQLIQRYGERTAVSGSPHIARLLSQNPADFFRTMLNREGDSPEVRAILESFVQRLQFARQYPSLEIEMRKGGDALDLLIDKIRNDKATAADKLKTADERAATFEQNAKEGKKTKEYRPRAAKTSTPVMDYLRGLGGVRPDSSAGKALEKIAPKAKYRSLYHDEGLRGLDNLDVAGFNDYGHDYGLNFEGLKTHEGDENPHYLNPEDIYREVEREVNGKGAKNTEDAAHDAAAEDILHVVDVMGLDFDKASNQQIKDVLNTYSKQWAPDASEGQRLYQSAYHGSPFKFDKFTLDHIGKGEGAQAYGWGLYFAGDKEVAEWYHRKLTITDDGAFYNGHTILKPDGSVLKINEDWKDSLSHFLEYAVDNKMTAHEAIADARAQAKNAGFWDRLRGVGADEKLFKFIEDKGLKVGKTPGNVYEVDIPEKEEMLDWDKTVDSQPPGIKEALAKVKDVLDKGNALDEISEHLNADFEDWTGREVYKALERFAGENPLPGIDNGLEGGPSRPDESASKYLNSIGIKGLQYLDGSSRKKGEGHHNSVVFDDSAIRSLKTFYQGGGEKPRGSITFPVDGSPLIHLFEGENLSTILHEYGHLYWHTLDALSKLEGATEQIRADVNAVREWAGAEGSDPLTTEQEEKIADGFLRYLKDHEAPSQEVMTSFQHFKSWLSNIYGGVKDALLPNINAHVKDVFDRMFATDDEIQRMKDNPEYSMDPRLAGFLTEAQKATAQRKHDRMVAEAKEKLFRKAMRQSEEKGTDEYKAARSQVEAETEQRIAAETRYQALAAAHTSGLDRKKSLAAYGKYGKEAMEYLKQHRGLFKKGGVDPEVLAGLHGFNSARDMLDAFQKMEPRKEYAARLTDETMTARHGDMLKDGSIEREAVQAFHNGMRAQVLEWEMKQAAALGKIAAPGAVGIEYRARQILGARKMSEIVPSRFYKSEIAAAKRYGEALGKKDFEGAAVAKAQQLLNHYLYEKALAARDFRDKMLTKWTKKLLKPDEKLAKTMDMDFVYAARSILAAHGIGSGKFDYEEWFQHLIMDDPETANTMREVIENAGLANAKPIKDMTYAEFQGLADNIQALIHIGTDSKTITIHGQRYDRKMLIQELTDMASNSGGSGLASGMGGKVPDKDLNKKGILGLSGYIRRSENMLTKLDQYRMDGPFRKIIWSPVKEAVEKYRDARDEILKKTLAIIEPERERLLGEKITAAELVSENTGESYTFENKAELVGMMQHLGNGFEPGSNGYKLLRGYGWKPEQLTAFLHRAHLSGLITKADWDLVQKIWDMYGSQKDAIWKAHREMRGFYPSDIDAVPVKTPFGEYAGGYAPAIVDRTKSTAIDDKELKNQITNEDNNFAFPSTGRGATMQRVAHSAYPLEMNLMTLPKHMDWAMKFIHIEPVVKQIAKVLFDKNFKEAMDQVNPAMVGEVLVPWLQRTARQSMNMSRDKANPIVQKVTAYLRRNNQLQALGFNPIYMVQRIGSLGPMIQTTGGAHTIAAIGDLLQNRGELRQQIKEESAFMRHRNNTVDENVQLKMQRVLQDRSGREKVRDWAIDHGYIIQHLTHGFLDDLQYLAAKYQAQAGEVDGVDPDKPDQVQAHAEKAVRYTQGSFHPEDASRVEASGSWFNKLGTVFYGIMNSQGNMLYDQAQRIKQSDASGFSKGMSGLYLYAMGYAVPAMVAAGVSAAIKGGTPTNQTPEKFWLETLLGSQLSYGMGMLPWVRDLANPIINKLEDRHYDDQVALGGSLLDFLNKVFVDTPGDLKDYLLNSGSGKKVLNDLLSDFGYAAQVPVTPLRRAMNYGIAVHQGTDTADNPGQIARGIIGGPHPKE